VKDVAGGEPAFQALDQLGAAEIVGGASVGGEEGGDRGGPPGGCHLGRRGAVEGASGSGRGHGGTSEGVWPTATFGGTGRRLSGGNLSEC